MQEILRTKWFFDCAAHVWMRRQLFLSNQAAGESGGNYHWQIGP